MSGLRIKIIYHENNLMSACEDIKSTWFQVVIIMTSDWCQLDSVKLKFEAEDKYFKFWYIRRLTDRPAIQIQAEIDFHFEKWYHEQSE